MSVGHALGYTLGVGILPMRQALAACEAGTATAGQQKIVAGLVRAYMERSGT